MLYQFVKDYKRYNSSIPSGTIHIGKYNFIRRYNRFEVYYSKLPTESSFTNVYRERFYVEPKDDEIRLYDIGDIGQEITAADSPEQVAQKYFGNSDFSTFFDHETLPLVSKHMALSRADIPRWLHAKPDVSVPSRVYTTYNPSRFEKFKQAVYKSGAALPLAAAAFFPTAMNTIGPDAAYYAIAAAPFVYGKDLLDSHRSNEAMRKKLMFTPSDRDQLVNTGAMATELAKRLVDGQTSHERYAILSRIHNTQKEKKEDVINQQAGKTKQAKRVKKYKSRKNKPNSKTKKTK
jgi:hypothetical protein